MREVIDGEEQKEGNDDQDIFAEIAANAHLPSFDQNKYPFLPEEDDGMNSPRIKDEIWGNYEIQSQDDSGCNALRQNPTF